MALIIQRIAMGLLQTNCYIISCENSGHTIIIDPGDDPKKIIDYIQRNEFIPKGMILTHGHYDHIGGVNILKGLAIPLMMNREDEVMLQLKDVKKVDRYLKDGELFDLGREKLKIIHTPGHSRGGICIYSKPYLFAGDTLFKDGVGRTDLPGGSSSELDDSIRNKLFILPKDTIVYPGHGPKTTIGSEMF